MKNAQQEKVVTVAASDLTYLIQCLRCFYLKIAHGIRPPGPMSSMWGRLDRRQRQHFNGQRSESIDDRLPPGIIRTDPMWLTSSPITVPGTEVRLRLRGGIDGAVYFDDGTFGIIDFKTIEGLKERVALYWTQLHAYALAAENPAEGKQGLAPVNVLGVLCLEPGDIRVTPNGRSYDLEPIWIPFARKDDDFMTLLKGVAYAATFDGIPSLKEGCPWCDYQRQLQALASTN